MRSSSAFWGLLVAHRAEVHQTVAVTKWAVDYFGAEAPVVLLGSSAGAPIAGSALASLPPLPYVAVGYTFGGIAAIGFGRHFGAVLRAPCPKLFIQGGADEFTSPRVLRRRVAQAAGEENEVVIVDDVGHFELESSAYDGLVARTVLGWLESRGHHEK
jgi:fermentation-respiration switch protein FrsA (DUF1100 family)